MNPISRSQVPFKIVFCGLDNSGKTSILLVLENKFSLLNSLSPTKGIERSDFDLLGIPIIKWDLGGQVQFRETYIKTNQLESTDLLFFIIDTQDSSRFGECFQYLSDIIGYFKEPHQKVPYFVICLHKIDPDLINDPNIQAHIQILENKLKELINFDYVTFQTSIYNNWTLRKAFSKGLLKLSPKSTLLDSMMEDFLEITRSDTILLLDQDALIFSECYHDPESYQLVNIIAPRLATMADKLMKYGKEIEVFEGKIGGWIYFKPISIKNKTFYIILFNKVVETVEEINFALPNLTEKITNTLQAFFI